MVQISGELSVYLNQYLFNSDPPDESLRQRYTSYSKSSHSICNALIMFNIFRRTLQMFFLLCSKNNNKCTHHYMKLQNQIHVLMVLNDLMIYLLFQNQSIAVKCINGNIYIHFALIKNIICVNWKHVAGAHCIHRFPCLHQTTLEKKETHTLTQSLCTISTDPQCNNSQENMPLP